jgi:hypothetical protein
MVVLTVLLLLGALLIQSAENSLCRIDITGRSQRAFHLAEAGLDKALWELSQYHGWENYDGENTTQVAGGFFDVAVSPTAATRLSSDLVHITARGYLPGVRLNQRVPQRILVVVSRNRPWPFGYALAASGSIDVGSALVDSYRSKDGPYGGTNVHANAAVAVNATTYQEGGGGVVVSGVRVLSNGNLQGSVLTGTASPDPAAVVNANGTIAGPIGALESPLSLEPLAVPAGAIDLGVVELSGSDSLTLTTGIYRADSISITGATATLYISGEVDLYVDGDILVAGNGIANAEPGKPRNLRIYGTENCTSVQIKGSSTFYGVVYAPSAEIVAQGSTNSGDIFGALVGAAVKLEGSNTCFHYDESLALAGDGVLDVHSWQEL